PGGNITGVTSMNNELSAKRLGLIRELRPKALRFAVLVNPDSQTSSRTAEVEAVASAIGLELNVFAARTNREIDGAFVAMVQKRSDALLSTNDPLFIARRVQVSTLAAHHHIPAIYAGREFTEAGGLMSYGANLEDLFRQTGGYAGRILKG